MNTHKVIDHHYDECENIDIVGTKKECNIYYEEQCKFGTSNTFMLEVAELTEEELIEYNNR